MKLIRIVIFFPLALVRLSLVLLISAVIAAIGMVWLKLFGFSRGLQSSVLRVWGKSMVFICNMKVTCNVIPGYSHFILMSNHRSYLDIAVLAARLPASFVAKSEVLSWPLMKTAARLSNIIFVSRSELKSSVSALNKIKSSVKQGLPVAVFPEGTTHRGPLTGNFKKGSFKVASDSDIPIIPFAIHYEDEGDAWVDDDTFIGHFFRQMGKPVTHVHLMAGDAITGGDATVLLKKVKEQIDMMLNVLIARAIRRKQKR